MGKIYTELDSMQWPSCEITPAQQQRIVKQAMDKISKEKAPAPSTRQSHFPVWKLVAAAAALCCLCVGGVAAAGHFLTPSQVAEQMEQQKLAALFEGKDSLSLQETRQTGQYVVTLLGLTSGENVTEYWSSDWEGEDSLPGRSYAVLSVSRSDGTPMADLDAKVPDLTVSDSLVSPVLAAQDCPLTDFNVFTMNGARRDIVRDGVRYILVETDQLEPFADKDPKLAVVLDGTGSITDLLNNFEQDASTGAIAPRAGTENDCLLFDLPLDESKADPEQAALLRKQWLGDETSEEEEAAPTQESEIMAEITPEQVRAEGTLQSSETVGVTDGPYGAGWYYGKDGFITSRYGWPAEATDVVNVWSDDGLAVLLTYNEDNTLTVEQWRIPVS